MTILICLSFKSFECNALSALKKLGWKRGLANLLLSAMSLSLDFKLDLWFILSIV